MHNRLSGWKAKLLNKAGRVTLAKSMLTALPVYNMQTMWLPNAVCDEIDITVTDFIWCTDKRKGLHLVKWK